MFTRVFITIFVVFVAGFVAGTANADLVAHWTFDEGEGTVAHDSAGSYDGTVNGASWTAGKVGGALAFNGTSNYVYVPDNDALDITGDITIAAWVYFNRGGNGQDGSQQSIVAKTLGNGSYNTPYDFRTSANAEPMLYISRSDATGHEAVSNTQTIPLLSWHHLAVTVSNNVADFYIDGVLSITEGMLTKPAAGNSRPLYIGRRDNGLYLNGLIDDVRLYNNALSQSEIQALIPEPATLLLFGFGALMLNRKSRS